MSKIIDSYRFGGVSLDTIVKDTAVLNYNGAGSTNTATITIADNSNRVVIIGVATYKPGDIQAVTGVTVDGNAATQLTGCANNSDDMGIDIFYYIAPPTGSIDIVATFAASVTLSTVGVLSAYNVSAVQNGASDAGATGSSAITVTAASTSWCFTHCTSLGSSGAGTTETEDWDDRTGAVVMGQHDTSPTGPSEAHDFGTLSNQWATAGCEMVPSSS